MAAVNSFGWIRNYIVLRIFGLIVFCTGLLIYGVIAWLGYIEVMRLSYSSRLEFILSFLKYAVLFPGFVPLIVGLRFLLLFRTAEEFAKGLFIFLPLFVVAHYVVSVVSAHDSAWPYIALQLAEILLVGVVLFKYRKR